MSRALHQERLMTVIQGPHLSEKSAIAAENGNQVVFKVRPDASKTEIRQAVELLFDVKVEGVSVVNVKGKVKRTVRGMSRKKDWKKAYVRLQEGHDIDFAGGA